MKELLPFEEKRESSSFPLDSPPSHEEYKIFQISFLYLPSSNLERKKIPDLL